MAATIEPSNKLHSVAKYQRAVILSLLANIALVIFVFLRTGGVIQPPLWLDYILRVVALIVMLFMAGSVFMLAKQFTNIVFALLVAILMVVPLLSLILLLVFNQKATDYLRQHGVKVGFLGVNPSSIP